MTQRNQHKANPILEKWLDNSRGNFQRKLKAIKEYDSVANFRCAQDKIIAMAKIDKHKAIRYEASKVCLNHKLLYKGKSIVPKSTKDNPIQSYIGQIKATVNYYKNRDEQVTLADFIEKFKMANNRAFSYFEFRQGDKLVDWMKIQIMMVPNHKDVIILPDDESAA